jgi:MYXO-CTERM domain-containing protein
VRSLLPLALALLSSSASAQTRFRFPADDPQGVLFMNRLYIHVDHSPTVAGDRMTCVTFDGRGFPWCYAGHDGTDYLLLFGFATMDQNDVRVVAAAEGEVIGAIDGNYDRCHGVDASDVSCDGNPIVANGVTVRHADGLVSKYWHLKKGSVKVKVGQRVACGELLGYVGSSGPSATPHLHFEVRDPSGGILDPYAGQKSQPVSYWTEQVGPDGWPGEHCAGEPLDAAPRDLGPSTTRDGRTGADPSLGVGSGAGCAVPAGSPPLTGVLVVAMLLAMRRRR